MKNIVTILGAAAAIIAIADFIQRQKLANEVNASAQMNAGTQSGPRWWSQSGSPDKVMQVNGGTPGGSQFGVYGVLPPYPFS